MTSRDKKALTALGIGLAAMAAVYSTLVVNAQNQALEDYMDTKKVTPVIEVVEKNIQDEPVDAPKSIIPDYAAEMIGRTIWGEAGGVTEKAERAAVAWCILNRVDASGDTIQEVVTAPHQFQGYRPEGDCPQEHIDLAADVLQRWEAEKQGADDVGRVLPADYLYFLGDGERNHFTTEFLGTDAWDWSLTNPYK
jgi:hypothetical protein